MKKLLILFCLFFSVPLGATSLPDNIYFKAMKDEMDRSLKQLRLPPNSKPSYIAYWVERSVPLSRAAASLGALDEPHGRLSPHLNIRGIVSLGNNKEDSLGIQENGQTWFSPTYDMGSVADSYLGIRQALWQITDKAYLQAVEMYEKKKAYKRRKQLDETLPDVVPAPAANYVEKILPPPALDEKALQQLAQRLSAQGNSLPYVEQFYVRLSPVVHETYFLNSRGSFFQYSTTELLLRFEVVFRTKSGYKRSLKFLFSLDLSADFKSLAEKETSSLLTRVQAMYNAQQGEAYVGPVLLMPMAAADLWGDMFVQEAKGAKPILWLDGSPDTSSGQFKNKLGMRVVSNAVSVYDRPHAKAYNGFLLTGFSPVDDEGTWAQDLTLATGGILRDLPRSVRPAKKGDTSNGHGRVSSAYFPREQISNLWVEAVNPLSQTELENKLLEKCRALELEYCYILHDNPLNNYMERIYTADGHKEPVDQLKYESGFTARSLRDIVAAGDTPEVFPNSPTVWLGHRAIVTPALLVEEMELVPVQALPDKKPFLPMP